jgi:DNA polymerase-3 subunit epsilon
MLAPADAIIATTSGTTTGSVHRPHMLTGRSLADCDFVAVDLETTGCRPGRNSIIEIGAVRFNASGIFGVFEQLVRPEDLIPHAVEELTGITSGMVAAQPPVEDAIVEFRDFAAGAVLVAHNYRFDLLFLDYEAERSWGAPLQRPVIDTLFLLRRLRPDIRRFSLSALATAYELETRPDHRAGNDARATAQLLLAVLPDLQRLGFATVGDVVAFSGLAGQRELAERLVLTKDVPDEPGVYLFRDACGRVLFVGHARSLRTRTRQYFYPGASSDSLAKEVASITVVPTLSHLDSLLLEHRIVDRHKPRYNPAAHRSREGYLIKSDAGSRYPGLRLVPVPRLRGHLMGPFTSKWAAETLLERLTSLYDLRRCARRLGSELAMTPCPRRDAGTCPAPCVRVIDPVAYATRVHDALSALTDGADFRSRLAAGQRAAAASGDYEEAIRDRDGLRALDRAMGSLETIREAALRDVVLIEEADGNAVVSFVRGGLRAAVLRGPRAAIGERVPRTLQRVYFSGATEVDPLRLTSEKLAELLIVAGFGESGAHLEVPVTTEAKTAARVMHSLGLDRRTPRRRHGAASAV